MESCLGGWLLSGCGSVLDHVRPRDEASPCVLRQSQGLMGKHMHLCIAAAPGPDGETHAAVSRLAFSLLLTVIRFNTWLAGESKVKLYFKVSKWQSTVSTRFLFKILTAMNPPCLFVSWFVWINWQQLISFLSID